MFDLFSDAATTIEMTMTSLNTPTILAEATPVASVPCRHSFDPKRRSGYVLALAGGHAR
jgi:hypothetical protein